MSSYVVGKQRCPQCEKEGRDTSGDNLILYSDGHSYCYGCHTVFSGDKVSSFKSKLSDEIRDENHSVFLPVDCDIIYPQRALDWCSKYDLTKNDLLFYNVMWSESMQRLIFPIYGDEGLLAWQGRSFHTQNMALAKIAKWYGKGDLKNTFNILGKGNKLVLTEDIISAIKVSKCGVQAMPLYGCVVGRQRFKRLYSLYKDLVEVVVWLDYDKRKEALSEAKLGRICGLNCTSISTELDPKELTYNEIKEKLNVN